MSLLPLLRPRVMVLLLLWSLPVLLYLTLGMFALYETGWLKWIAFILPGMWSTAWLVGKAWKPPSLQQHLQWKPLVAPEFWTPQDTAAIQVVEEFRCQVEDIDRATITDANRYLHDANEMAKRLATHYHARADRSIYRELTMIEIFAVIQLSVSDLEEWVLENVPGSNLATIGQLEHLPRIAEAVDIGQSIVYFASSILNPGKLLAYPLWRKSGRLAIVLQNELVREFYQRYLRQVGYYLIEMYSGRLKGGSRVYREHFASWAVAAHAAGGDTTVFAQLSAVSTTIAVMGQVKAGKSSLINALMKDKVAATSVLPETRQVQSYRYLLPGSETFISLLDTPGYSEADVTKRQQREIETASEKADIILLTMAANSPARDTDLQMVRRLTEHYRQNKNLKPPTIIGVLTHIDSLRPLREWSPPYDWRNPNSEKEQSIASAVNYAKELFGDMIAGYACVYTGELLSADSSVAEEVVPQLVDHLDHGHAAAVLKAFYQQLSQQRFKQMSLQVIRLLKTSVESLT